MNPLAYMLLQQAVQFAAKNVGKLVAGVLELIPNAHEIPLVDSAIEALKTNPCHGTVEALGDAIESSPETPATKMQFAKVLLNSAEVPLEETEDEQKPVEAGEPQTESSSEEHQADSGESSEA